MSDRPIHIKASQGQSFFVRNVNGTGSHKCIYHGSWINHYLHLSGSERITCAVLGCNNFATHGAHVQVREIVSIYDGNSVSISSNEWWIAPFCIYCNNERHNYTGEGFDLKSNVVLVSANKERTGCF